LPPKAEKENERSHQRAQELADKFVEKKTKPSNEIKKPPMP
jgi:hypothetical protein